MLRTHTGFGWLLLILMVAGSGLLITPAQAQLTPAHRKELAEITKEVGQIATTIRKKDYDTAETQLKAAEEKLKSVTTASGATETDPAIKRVSALIEKQRAALSKAGGGSTPGGAAAAEGISFVKEIAPIISERCLRCHGENNPRRNLRLDSFAGWQRGGQGGVLLVPGNPNNSLLLARLNAPQGQGRMPTEGDPLSDEEKTKIANWIRTGAKFDGANPAMTLRELMIEEDKKTVQIPKPKGSETVSFTRDIAPWMANLCLGCHNTQRKQGGLSVETFFDIMKGGESGEVILPGNHEESRFFRLVGGLELPRMPANQARLTRKNYEDMKKWFEEGNTYDGNDPLTPIRQFVPTDAELAQRKFGTKSDAEMRELRVTRTGELYRAANTGPMSQVETEEFLIVGDVDQSRLQNVANWAKAQLGPIQKTFGGSGLPWRGRLAIFVFKDRTGYEDFATLAEKKRASRDVYGHYSVTLGFEDAYLVLQDTGDTGGHEPSLQENLIQQLTAAYLTRSAGPFPRWAALGLGFIQSEGIAGPERIRLWKEESVSIAAAVNQPDELFADGTFSASSTGPIGYTLLKFIESQGGKDRFPQFVKALERGDTVPAAIKATYGAEGSTVASEYFKSLRAR